MEILLSLFFLSVGIVAVLHSFLGALDALQDGEKRQWADQLAQEKMWQIEEEVAKSGMVRGEQGTLEKNIYPFRYEVTTGTVAKIPELQRLKMYVESSGLRKNKIEKEWLLLVPNDKV